MEVAGLAIGAVSLASLVDACVGAYDRIHSFRDFESKTRTLVVRFEATRLRFKEWADQVKPDLSPSNDLDGEIKKTMEYALTHILQTLNSVAEKFGAMIGPDYLANEMKVSTRHRLAFALGGKKQLTEDVQDLEAMVSLLDHLRAKASHPTTQPGTSDPGIDIADLLKRLEIDKHDRRIHANMALKFWLDAPDSDKIYENLRACRTDGTCTWLLDRPEIQRWLAFDENISGSSANCLWLHGPPGFGKSVVSAFLIEHLRSLAGFKTLHYFCSASQEKSQRASSILRSCIVQFAASGGEPVDLAWRIMDRSTTSTANTDDLWKILSAILESGTIMTLVIDGFDECHEFDEDVDRKFNHSRATFLCKLKDLFSRSRSRLAVISRDEIDIRKALTQQKVEVPTKAVVECRITASDVQLDVLRFAEQTLSQKLGKKSFDLRQNLAQSIAQKSQGMFLWVQLQEKELRPTMNTKRLQETVQSMPIGLETTYERDWIRIAQNCDIRPSDKERAFKILRWTTGAVRPLTLLELVTALAIPDEITESNLIVNELPEALADIDMDWVMEELLRFTGSLLIVRMDTSVLDPKSDTIEPVHFSARAFLASKFEKGLNFEQVFYEDNLLARRCLAYLYFSCKGLTSNFREEDFFGDQDRENEPFPFAQYALVSWFQHVASRGELYDEFILVALSFFENDNCLKILSWWTETYELSSFRSIFDVALSKNQQGNSEQPTKDNLEAEQNMLTPGEIPHHEGMLEPWYSDQERTTESTDRGSASYYAALYGLLPVVQNIIVKSPQNSCIRGGLLDYPLDAACFFGHTSVVAFLLDLGLTADKERLHRGMTMQCAILGENAEIVSMILATKPPKFTLSESCDAQKTNRMPPICLAAYFGLEDIARLLVANEGMTSVSECSLALIYAARGEHTELCRTLLEAGADMYAMTEGFNAMGCAIINGSKDIVDLFCEFGYSLEVPVSTNGLSALFFTLFKEDVPMMEHLVVLGADVSCMIHGMTVLHACAFRGQAHMVFPLFTLGADPGSIDCDGRTPLHYSAWNGHLDATRALCANGCTINATNKYGSTPLDYAQEYKHTETAEYLITLGAVETMPTQT